ncbi:uncharacterized protein IL334_003580 [Kwoniella shivajii]|uniref:Ricin B lectin domain-containing protein n=1 Tax=Kwoniella shivajii TaxID=564305 RepID=A0ABZ1D0X4_9TREE|nr:hypothetical protein IL334_003580 [Kwoniella shivajii]
MIFSILAFACLATASLTSAATIKGKIRNIDQKQCIGFGGVDSTPKSSELGMVDCASAPEWQVDEGDQGGYVLYSPQLTTALLVTENHVVGVADSYPGDETQQLTGCDADGGNSDAQNVAWETID